MDEWKKLYEERNAAVKAARDIVAKADTEKRALTAEDRAAVDKALARAGELKDEIERRERLETEEKALQTSAERRTAPDAPGGTPPAPKPPAPTEIEVRGSKIRLAPGSALARRATGEYRDAFRNYLVSGAVAPCLEETRAMSVGTDSQGGYLVPAESFVAQLLKGIDDMVFIRQRATVMQVGQAQSLGVPTLEANPADANWTTELATGSEDSTMAFGKRELRPWPLAKLLKASNTLLRTSPIDPETIIRDRLGYKFAITEETAFLNGDGASQPLGVFTASDDGIGTARDVSTGNAATSIMVDGLKNAKYSLKAGYRADPSCAWLFHREAVNQISTLKDGVGQYLWEPSIRRGDPDTILGLPLMESEYAPHSFLTTLYVGLLGCWRFYWIADSLSMTVQRLVELYAATNQVGFIGRLECDGMPVLAEAFARVKLA